MQRFTRSIATVAFAFFFMPWWCWPWNMPQQPHQPMMPNSNQSATVNSNSSTTVNSHINATSGNTTVITQG